MAERREGECCTDWLAWWGNRLAGWLHKKVASKPLCVAGYIKVVIFLSYCDLLYTTNHPLPQKDNSSSKGVGFVVLIDNESRVLA